MPFQKQTSQWKLSSFTIIDLTKKQYVCNYCTERNVIIDHPGNLLRHLKSIHPNEAKVFNITLKRSNNVDQVEEPIVKRQRTSRNFHFIKSNIESVVLHYLPFAYFNYDSTRNLLKMANNSIILSSEKMVKYVSKMADIIREMIKNEIRGRTISVMLDIATRHNRSVLGINVQYFSYMEHKVVIRTLAMRELLMRHSAENLRKELMDVLSNYEINIRQLASITVDNGSNLLKLSHCLAYDQNIHLLTDFMKEMRDKDGNIYEECEFEDEIDSTYMNMIINQHNQLCTLVTIIRCAAHVTQLAVYDALKELNENNDIRSVVKQLKGFGENTH